MRNLKILLIEDDMIEVMKLNRAKSSLQLNHRIIEANNGEDALLLFGDWKKNTADLLALGWHPAPFQFHNGGAAVTLRKG